MTHTAEQEREATLTYIAEQVRQARHWGTTLTAQFALQRLSEELKRGEHIQSQQGGKEMTCLFHKWERWSAPLSERVKIEKSSYGSFRETTYRNSLYQKRECATCGKVQINKISKAS